MTLDQEDIAAIAQAVAELLQPAPESARLVDARTLAKRLGTSPAFVYRHQRELGARRIGGGRKPRLRFDVAEALQARERINEPRPVRAPARRRPTNGSSIPLLPVHDG